MEEKMAKKRTNWYPDGRHAQLDLAQRWISVFSETVDGTGGQKKISRGGPLNAAVNTTFTELEKQSREIKRRCLFSPPLASPDFDALGIRGKDTTRTPYRPRNTPLW
jgi:hypothetical protein